MSLNEEKLSKMRRYETQKATATHNEQHNHEPQ